MNIYSTVLRSSTFITSLNWIIGEATEDLVLVLLNNCISVYEDIIIMNIIRKVCLCYNLHTGLVVCIVFLWLVYSSCKAIIGANDFHKIAAHTFMKATQLAAVVEG